MQTDLRVDGNSGPFRIRQPKRVGFLRRLLCSYPKINAFIELNNMLASRSRPTEVPLEMVDILNEEYMIDMRKRFASDLASLYKSSLRHCLNQKQFTNENLEDFVHLVKLLGISFAHHVKILSEFDGQAGESQKTVSTPENIFFKELSARIRAEAPGDHEITQEEQVAPDHNKKSRDLSSWLRIPAIAPGGSQSIVGESHYQSTLLKACGGRTENGTTRTYATACLVLEPRNRYDKNAVRVDVGGKIVGYIPAEEAKRFHPIIHKINTNGKPATCRIRFIGGWDRGDDDIGLIGVELDIDPHLTLMHTETPFLPQDRPVQVVGEQCCQEWLESIIKGKKKHILTASLTLSSFDPHKVGEGIVFISVACGETKIGSLQTQMETLYMPLLRSLTSAGCPTTCRAEVWRAKKRLEVTLYLPEPDVSID